ncbi:MAG: hypothetical protein GX921_03470 [Bacteroidales bacterium]|nr:hypothetical protein [Bacteroidales bacterium]
MQSKEFIKKQLSSLVSGSNSKEYMEFAANDLSLIILDVAIMDYTLSEIARLVEDNNARIVRLETLPLEDGISLLVSLKVDVIDISPVLRSFERYSYNVIYYFMREGEMNETYEDRLKELMHYLDI